MARHSSRARRTICTFPAVGLAVYATQSKRGTDEMFIEAARAVADQVTPVQLQQGMLYPPQSNILETEVRTAERVRLPKDISSLAPDNALQTRICCSGRPLGWRSEGGIRAIPVRLLSSGYDGLCGLRGDRACGQATNTTNESNDPVTPKKQILLQNCLMPARMGMRVERNAGLGVTTVFDLALRNVGKFTLGAGPLLVLPVAAHSNMGDGKWQAGPAATVVTERGWGLIGTVIYYQHSFSGYGSRPPAELLSMQPLIHYNFKNGYLSPIFGGSGISITGTTSA